MLYSRDAPFLTVYSRVAEVDEVMEDIHQNWFRGGLLEVEASDGGQESTFNRAITPQDIHRLAINAGQMLRVGQPRFPC